MATTQHLPEKKEYYLAHRTATRLLHVGAAVGNLKLIKEDWVDSGKDKSILGYHKIRDVFHTVESAYIDEAIDLLRSDKSIIADKIKTTLIEFGKGSNSIN